MSESSGWGNEKSEKFHFYLISQDLSDDLEKSAAFYRMENAGGGGRSEDFFQDRDFAADFWN